ncbi:MAG: PEP-CTERM sorting domain-containing protein [Phycisphaerae bacterium]
MRSTLIVSSVVAALAFASGTAQAQNLLSNGDLDLTVPTEIVPGFFLPKPQVWENIGTRSISGPYEDEMSSEPWAGPAPTPVTADDWGVFFKAFTGGPVTGAATGHLQQAVGGSPGVLYTLTGWAGAEANFLADGAVFAIDFLDAGNNVIGGNSVDLLAGLFVPNGQPFNYKSYSVSAVAPAGTVLVRARASMIDGVNNPAGGGQAFVVDDFTLVPEPTTALGMLALGLAALARRR